MSNNILKTKTVTIRIEQPKSKMNSPIMPRRVNWAEPKNKKILMRIAPKKGDSSISLFNTGDIANMARVTIIGKKSSNMPVPEVKLQI